MSLTINTNTTAMSAAFNLAKNNLNLQKSINRLASGKRIVSSSDDAGGLAVSMKLTSSINRSNATISNIQNALSFTEVQDGVLQAASRIVDRMGELKTHSMDVMKSSVDIQNYNTEFKALQQQLHALSQEKFNGVSLFAATTTSGTATTFGSTSHTVSIFTSDLGAGGSMVSLHKSQLVAALTFNGTTAASVTSTPGSTGGSNIALSNSTGTVALGDLSVSFFTTALQNVATLRAENGATVSRLMFAADHMRLTSTNLQAARSRIMDVDIATESTNLAKVNILTQASTAMLAQANQAPNAALMLLG